jgi:elongation factor P
VISATDAKKGVKILYKNEPHVVLDYQHVKPGKGAAFVRLKIKNLITRLQLDITARPDQKLEKPDLQYKEVLFLYKEGDTYIFMDQEDFDQVEISQGYLEDVLRYMKEQVVYTILYWGDRPINVTPPLHMELEVVEAPPGVKGDTAQGGGSKQVELETGYVLQVPLFINQGDVVRVDTRDGSYLERVSKAE